MSLPDAFWLNATRSTYGNPFLRQQIPTKRNTKNKGVD
jgi:hypothetical protein